MSALLESIYKQYIIWQMKLPKFYPPAIFILDIVMFVVHLQQCSGERVKLSNIQILIILAYVNYYVAQSFGRLLPKAFWLNKLSSAHQHSSQIHT